MLALSCRAEPRARVLVDPDRGALVRSWIVPVGRVSSCERLYLESWADAPSPPDLRGGIPVLFPFAGRVAAPPGFVPGTWCWDGALHASMPIHGFAHSLPWTVLSATRHSATLALSDTPATRAIYPFAFELRLRVSFPSPTALSLRLAIRNTGTSPLPCTPGFHPYFRLPSPDAPTPVPHFRGNARPVPYDATCTALVPSPIPPGAPPPDTPHVYISDASDVDLALPRGLVLRAEHAFSAGRLRYWQPYRRPGAPFYCLEPWTAPAGAVNYLLPGGLHRLIPPSATRILSFSLLSA